MVKNCDCEVPREFDAFISEQRDGAEDNELCSRCNVVTIHLYPSECLQAIGQARSRDRLLNLSLQMVISLGFLGCIIRFADSGPRSSIST